MADRVLVAPPGITRPDQFAERNTQRMPQPMMGPRPSLIVGGPAYFTPEGYQAPVQPEQSFMPTGGRPNLIRDSFNRQLPPIQRPQPQTGGINDPAVAAAAAQLADLPAPTQTGGVGDPARYQASQEPDPENNFFIDGDGNLTVGDGIIRTMGPPMGQEDSNTSAPTPSPAPPPAPVFTPPPPPTTPEPNGFFPGVTPDFSKYRL